MSNNDLLEKIRTVPDFPKPGILFYDLTTLLQDPHGLTTTIDRLAESLSGDDFDLVIGIDARGFILASALAYKFGKGLVLVRKPGKLPHDTHAQSYDLEYGSATLEIHQDTFKSHKRAVIVDDLLATGGTARAAGDLVHKAGGELVSYHFVMELGFLPGREALQAPAHALICVEG